MNIGVDVVATGGTMARRCKEWSGLTIALIACLDHGGITGYLLLKSRSPDGGFFTGEVYGHR